MAIIHNERWKLTANWLNAVAAGTVIAGGISPLVAVAYGLRGDAGSVPVWLIITLTLVWISAGIMLHIMARTILGRLQE